MHILGSVGKPLHSLPTTFDRLKHHPLDEFYTFRHLYLIVRFVLSTKTAFGPALDSLSSKTNHRALPGRPTLIANNNHVHRPDRYSHTNV